MALRSRYTDELCRRYMSRGGPIRYDYGQIVDRAVTERFREAESTGADVLMTSCPACLMQFRQTCSRLRVVDITAIIWRQLILPGEKQMRVVAG